MPTQALATEFDFTLVDWPHGVNLGDWRAVELLGSGGTAEVWRAVGLDGRAAALKLVKRELRRHKSANALLRREHETLRAVASPHLVAPYDLIECAGATVLVLEYLPHGDLVPLVGAPPQQWLPAFSAVVAALAALERHGLSHGDLTARNVLFAADGSARLADLISARPLDAPAAVATAAYALPEPRARAREADRFALAALLFELATGQLPYGPSGASAGAEPTAAAVAEPLAAALKAAAVAALQARGRLPGLSYFVDVIESVRGKQD